MKNKLLVGLSFFVFIFNVLGFTTSAQTEIYEKSLDLINCESNTIQMEFDDRPYIISELTDVIIKVDSLSDIGNVNYDYTGFKVIQFNRESNDSFRVRLGFSKNVDSMKFKLIVKLSNDNVLVANIYGYQSNDLFFLSRSSTENTDLLYYDYAFRTDIITKEQYEEILFEKSCLAKENLDMSNSNIEDNISNQFSTMSSTSQASIVSGTWQWVEGGIAHPLKYTIVNVKYSGSNSLPVTASTSTDENGYFSIELMISNTMDVKVQVFSSGIMTNVRKNSFSYPYSYITSSKSLNPGGSISFDFILDNEEDINFKAFKISQALIMGEKYVESMTGEMAPSINCHYPKDSDDYDSFLDVINITEPAFNYWDVILHEYGHKVMDYYEIDDYLGGSHVINEDLIKRYSKVKGIGMAWGEGWPTFFAILVTQYYGSELNNIMHINDDEYNDYYFDSEGNQHTSRYSLEDGRNAVGEGCEAAVFAVLYDFYDSYSTSEPWDNLSYSHKTMFNAVINSKATTFSGFLNYFVNNYYSANDGKIGNILSHYGMSSTNLRISSGTLSYTTPPTFSWEAGGPASCNYNSFEIAFYNSKKAIILTTEKQSNTTLKLTLEQWNKIWDSDTTSVFVMVIAYQTSTPSTGPYYSVQLEISRPSDAPHIHNYTYKYTDAHTHKATCACGDSFQQAHYFITERLGQRCKYCRYYTEGPVITPGIMNSNLITKEDLYIPRKETIEVIEHI